MNALEKLVPKELETHLMLNYARFKTFEEIEQEVISTSWRRRPDPAWWSVQTSPSPQGAAPARCPWMWTAS